MPVYAPIHGTQIGSKRTSTHLADQHQIRPQRQSLFHNPDWPPAPDRAPPTPTAVRVAKARALSVAGIHSLQQNVIATQSGPKAARAQQMQARAIAAQAAHQRRLAGGPAIRPASPVASYAALSTDHTKRGLGAPTRQPLADRYTSTFDPDVTPRVYKESAQNPRHAFLTGGRYPPLIVSEEVVDLMDEITVEFALPVVDHPASPTDTLVDEAVGFTSPSADVDISAFMPKPGPPVLVANDETIAASAVPLSDWAADICWALVSRMLSPRSTAGLDPAQWLREASEMRSHAPVPATFQSFVNATLSATLPSPQSIFLGLWYVSRLPIGNFRRIPAELDHATTPPGVLALFNSLNTPSWSLRECEFREALYGASEEDEAGVAQLVITLALMLGNKWLEDNTFTTRTWHDVTNLPQTQLKTLETAALNVMEFSLAIKGTDWLAWLTALRARTSLLVAREPIGLVNSPNRSALGRVDGLLSAARETAQQQASVEAASQQASAWHGDDDIVLVGLNQDRPQRGHMRCSSLPGLHPYGRASTAGQLSAVHETLDTFQALAPHPSQVNAGIEARKRANLPSGLQYEAANATRGYRWGQVQAEMAAREREQEQFISGWPRPSHMEWSSTWSRPHSSAVGV